VDRLIRAVARLGPPPAHCYIIGDGPARPELERLVGELGLADRVTFSGHKSWIGDYLQVLDIFTLPSGPEESFGNALVEAMAVGIPCVIFADGGGLAEHIEDEVTGLVAVTERDYSEQMNRLVGDAELRQRLGTAAKSTIRQRYTLDAMIRRHDEFYGWSTR
jgi:glycosyltransferase involved in cell wall biosynthesis